AKGRLSFTDTDTAKHQSRFYRVTLRNSGTAVKSLESGTSGGSLGPVPLNVVGYYNVLCRRGFTMLANQLNAYDANNRNLDNTLAYVISSVPAGTQLYIYNPATG